MHLPKKLKIGGRTFKILYDNAGIMERARHDGTSHYSDQIISINTDSPRERQEECLIHEIIHAILTMTAMDDRLSRHEEELPEDLTTAMAGILYQVFKDNRMLRD